MTRATYRRTDGKLLFQPVGQQSFTISEQDPVSLPTGLRLLQPDELRNDITIIGELEPVAMFATTSWATARRCGFYLSETPFSKAAITVF